MKLCPAWHRPYHAGTSGYFIRNRYYSGDVLSALLLGIELECLDSQHCTYEQHDSCAELIVVEGIDRGWRWPYYILGHYEIATPLGRRHDPVGFDWGDFMGLVYKHATRWGAPGII